MVHQEMERQEVRVLLVEDHESDYALTRDLLGEIQPVRYDLEWVRTCEAARERMQTCGADLVLVDAELGAHTGYDLVREIAEQGCHVPFILLTGEGNYELEMAALEAGVADYLFKDRMDAQTLERSIRYALERWRIQEELRQREQFLARLNEITRAALECPNVQTMLQILADQLRELFAADSCYLTLWDDERNLVIPGATSGDHLNAYRSLRTEPGEPTLTESVLRAGRPLVVEDVNNTEYISRRLVEMFPDRSKLGLPLIADGMWLGATLVAFNEPHHFTPDEIARGEQAARQISLALARARLVESLEAEVEARTAQIRAEQEKSETILRSVGDAIMMTDLAMRVRYTNEAFTHLTGHGAEEVLGQPAGAALFGSETAHPWDALVSALVSDGTWQGEVVCRRRDGRLYEAALIVNPLRGVDGTTRGYVFSQRDISRRKELDRARGRFMVNVSHELRTPLTNLQLTLRLLLKQPHSEKIQRLLRGMAGQMDRLGHQIEEIILLAELDSGQAAMAWKPICMASIVEDTVTAYQQRAVQKGIELAGRVARPGLPQVQGDAQWLTRALAELMDNAILYTPPGGHVAVEADITQQDDVSWGTITVRDTGPGIPAEDQAWIFDRLSRGSLADTGHIPGTGLGLSVVQQIMHAHGGRVTMVSAPGQGSSFTLWLPAMAQPPGQLPDAESHPATER